MAIVMEKPEKLFENGPEWNYEGTVTRHKPKPVKSGHHWSCYELGAPVDVTIWDDGTASADTRGTSEHESADEAVESCRVYLRALRDELIRVTGDG